MAFQTTVISIVSLRDDIKNNIKATHYLSFARENKVTLHQLVKS